MVYAITDGKTKANPVAKIALIEAFASSTAGEATAAKAVDGDKATHWSGQRVPPMIQYWMAQFKNGPHDVTRV